MQYLLREGWCETLILGKYWRQAAQEKWFPRITGLRKLNHPTLPGFGAHVCRHMLHRLLCANRETLEEVELQDYGVGPLSAAPDVWLSNVKKLSVAAGFLDSYKGLYLPACYSLTIVGVATDLGLLHSVPAGLLFLQNMKSLQVITLVSFRNVIEVLPFLPESVSHIRSLLTAVTSRTLQSTRFPPNVRRLTSIGWCFNRLFLEKVRFLQPLNPRLHIACESLQLTWDERLRSELKLSGFLQLLRDIAPHVGHRLMLRFSTHVPSPCNTGDRQGDGNHQDMESITFPYITSISVSGFNPFAIAHRQIFRHLRFGKFDVEMRQHCRSGDRSN